MINVNLDVNEINYIIEVLSQQAYRNVAGLMGKIQMQVIPQMQALPQEEPPAAE